MSAPGAGRWRRPRSLRTQLLFWLVTLHLVAAAITAWFTFVAYGDLVHNALDEQMRLVADSYAGGDPPRTPRPLDADAALLRGAFVVQLWSADGRTLRASLHCCTPCSSGPAPSSRASNSRTASMAGARK